MTLWRLASLPKGDFFWKKSHLQPQRMQHKNTEVQQQQNYSANRKFALVFLQI